jgi:hypothetical protein
MNNKTHTSEIVVAMVILISIVVLGALLVQPLEKAHTTIGIKIYETETVVTYNGVTALVLSDGACNDIVNEESHNCVTFLHSEYGNSAMDVLVSGYRIES